MMNRQKPLRPKAPDKGSFPLDHDGECKDAMNVFMECMKKTSNDNSKCRVESKAYLQCRIDKGLMADESMSKLGYRETTKDRTLPS